MNNGLSTGYFDIKRGVRQGDPFSSILFVNVMEVVLIRIRNDQDIEGIEINDTTCIKMSCYADDLTCFPKNIRSARKIMQVLDNFHRFSSLKINVEKTEGMWLGNNRLSNDKPLPIIWTNKVKVLGIVFSYDENLATSLNFDDKIISLKQTLALWKSRDLTVIACNSPGLFTFIFYIIFTNHI